MPVYTSRRDASVQQQCTGRGLTAGLDDVGLEALSLELAKSGDDGAAGRGSGVLAGAAEGAELSLGVDGNVGEGEEHVARLPNLHVTSPKRAPQRLSFELPRRGSPGCSMG